MKELHAAASSSAPLATEESLGPEDPSEPSTPGRGAKRGPRARRVRGEGSRRSGRPAALEAVLEADADDKVADLDPEWEGPGVSPFSPGSLKKCRSSSRMRGAAQTSVQQRPVRTRCGSANLLQLGSPAASRRLRSQPEDSECDIAFAYEPPSRRLRFSALLAACEQMGIGDAVVAGRRASMSGSARLAVGGAAMVTKPRPAVPLACEEWADQAKQRAKLEGSSHSAWRQMQEWHSAETQLLDGSVGSLHGEGGLTEVAADTRSLDAVAASCSRLGKACRAGQVLPYL